MLKPLGCAAPIPAAISNFIQHLHTKPDNIEVDSQEAAGAAS